MNKLLLADSYKMSHYKLYPQNSVFMQSYFESRTSQNTKILFFGLQYYLKRYLEGVFVTEDDVYQAKEFAKSHFMSDDVFNEEGWLYIAKKLGGKLPIKIHAIEEGTVVTGRMPLITVESTDSKCIWVVNYIETLLSKVWYPITVATNSFNIKQLHGERHCFGKYIIWLRWCFIAKI